MKTKTSKASKIRAELEAGGTPKEVAAKLKVPVQMVYTENWKRKKTVKKKKEVLNAANKVFNKEYKQKVRMALEYKPDPALDFLREELASIERQIDNLNTIASFLAIRLRQLEQNGG